MKKRGRPRKDQAPSVKRRAADPRFGVPALLRGGVARGRDRSAAGRGWRGEGVPLFPLRVEGRARGRLPRGARPGNGGRASRSAWAGRTGWAGLHALFGLVEEWARSKAFRGCPFLNAVSELPDPAHPGREVARRQREWLHELDPRAGGLGRCSRRRARQPRDRGSLRRRDRIGDAGRRPWRRCGGDASPRAGCSTKSRARGSCAGRRALPCRPSGVSWCPTSYRSSLKRSGWPASA